ncbi:MAG: fructose-6-phosphate aldolase [Patescibacteria group bacterium]
MKLFVDTANVEEVRQAVAMGVVCGVTTNPSLAAQEGGDFHALLREICSLANGPVSAEVLAKDGDGMLAEAEKLVAIDQKNIAIKLPMNPPGLAACRVLSARKVKVNMTLVFNPNQAHLAALAGATYVSAFVGRLDDIGEDGSAAVRVIVAHLRSLGLSTEVIAASIRNPLHVIQAAQAGAHVATVPFKVIMQMTRHHLTDAGIAKFQEDWERVPKLA